MYFSLLTLKNEYTQENSITSHHNSVLNIVSSSPPTIELTSPLIGRLKMETKIISYFCRLIYICVPNNVYMNMQADEDCISICGKVDVHWRVAVR